MTSRWFTLLVMIGLLTQSGCQLPKGKNLNPLSVIRWVGSLIKQKPKFNYLDHGVRMKTDWKLEPLKQSLDPG